MKGNLHKAILLITILLLPGLLSFSQEFRPVKYVNPFIGTDRTGINSFWGSDGGTYPGAVAPSGFVQISPETNISSSRGYNYRDSAIFFFSCTGHMSGYPNGSSGRIHIMPVADSNGLLPGKNPRFFSHRDEKAEPGYYRVTFRDNGTIAEASASQRTGMLLFTFPPGTTPMVMLSDLGRIEIVSGRVLHGTTRHAVISFSSDIRTIGRKEGGFLLSFEPGKNRPATLLIKIGLSTVSFENAEANLAAETSEKSFMEYTEDNRKRWNEALSVIEVIDQSEENMTKFYTALYHSLLLPWIVSDADGTYSGADRKIHKTKGNDEYGAFSPWDTFRSLHPLLCLINPSKQKDIVLSMLDQFEQTGKLPGGPMTGNHVLAIIADSWAKGINGYDAGLAFEAMSATLDSASADPDMQAYIKLGFVPASFPESVTRTVEYAYDDWVMSKMAEENPSGNNRLSEYLSRRSSYRNLFDHATLYMVPRLGDDFERHPGYSGYKEGDKYSYSMFVPHDPVDLVNIMGGTEMFSGRLDSLLANELILFDNEPVLHIPYLFNYSLRPSETQKWVRSLMNSHYRNAPDGIPGNDDLGAMSSWFVFSAMGFYPFCPGRAGYDLGSPLFKQTILHLPGSKNITIRAENNGEENVYVKSVSVDGRMIAQPWISHSELVSCREMVFSMDKEPGSGFADFRLPEGISVTGNYSDIRINDFSLPEKNVTPDESFMAGFSLSNSGSTGTKSVVLYTRGKEVARKNVWVDQGATVRDSVECRLYPVGVNTLSIDNLPGKEINVKTPPGTSSHRFLVRNLGGPSVLKKGAEGVFFYSVKNLAGYADTTVVKLYADDSLIGTGNFFLQPGEEKMIKQCLVLNNTGIYTIKAGKNGFKVKVFENNRDACLANLINTSAFEGDTIRDASGFDNNGILAGENNKDCMQGGSVKTGEGCYVVIGNSPSVDKMGEKLTVMAWVRPDSSNRGLTDIITKGDFIALQSSGNRSLSFFAGGWGRGSCEAGLPDDWAGNWHHIAGVCDGGILRMYIDGAEVSRFDAGSPVNLSYRGKWMIGRNEEFPGIRIFNGEVRNLRIFSEALVPSEIIKEMADK